MGALVTLPGVMPIATNSGASPGAELAQRDLEPLFDRSRLDAEYGGDAPPSKQLARSSQDCPGQIKQEKVGAARRRRECPRSASPCRRHFDRLSPGRPE